MEFALAQFLTGLASASTLFLVASGLSIIFGVTRIVNFAHGSLYMLGAYLAYTVAEALAAPFGFWAALALSALAVGLIGAAMEVLLLRRLYGAPELFQLVATFAVVLVVQDVALWVWGPEDLLGPRAPGLEGTVRLLGARVPEYDLFLIALGPAVLGLLWLVLNRTRWGLLVRAATQDREMAAALGIDQGRLFTGVFFLGAALAGLGGALQLPREAVTLQMDLGIVVDAFVVVVVGGLGSLPGAFLAALLIAELHAFGILVLPEITLVLVFLVMAAVLVVRPHGLLGGPQGEPRGASGPPGRPLRPASPRAAAAAAALVAALAAFPLLAGDYAVVVATEALILALLAASLHLLMGPGGVVSFGHAAYFGLGAYGAALAVKHLGAGMAPALAAAPVLAAAGALVYGWFCVRLSGVYAAMLTLAFAQITWSVAFQWAPVTGGDNGILGVWPAPWAAPKWAFYLLTLALVLGSVLLLRRAVFSPFGMALRAGRDSPARADAVGIDVRRQRWLAFVLSGTLAGLAGGLYAFSKGSVFPTLLSVPTSVDALVMVLLGGVQSLAGPLVGAALFHGLEAEVSRWTEHWRLIVGAAVIALCVAFPQGAMGAIERGGRAVARAWGPA